MKINGLMSGGAPPAQTEEPDKTFKLIPPTAPAEDYSEQFAHLEDAIKRLKDGKVDMDVFEARMAMLGDSINQEEKTVESHIIKQGSNIDPESQARWNQAAE